MEAHLQWASIDAGSNVIALLKWIQECMMQDQTHKYNMHATHNAKGASMTDHDYYKKCKDIVHIAIHFGSSMGGSWKYVNAVLLTSAADPNNPTDKEVESAIKKAQSQFVAMGLLLHSDQQQYAGMVHDIENQYTYGKNIYPDTLGDAYKYLINYKSNALKIHHTRQQWPVLHDRWIRFLTHWRQRMPMQPTWMWRSWQAQQWQLSWWIVGLGYLQG